MQEKEKEEIIILEDEITPPYNGSKREISMSQDKDWLLKKAEEENGSCTSVAGLIMGKNGVWKKDNYIIGKATPEDKTYCEKVDPLDLHSTIEIRKYILAVETYLSKKENERVFEEARYRIWKYIFCFVAGGSAVLWALYVGMINLTK